MEQKEALEDVKWLLDICEFDLEHLQVNFLCKWSIGGHFWLSGSFPKKSCCLTWNFIASSRKHCILKIGEDDSIHNCLFKHRHTHRRQDGDPLLCKYSIPKQLKIEGTVGKTASEESGSQIPSNGGRE